MPRKKINHSTQHTFTWLLLFGLCIAGLPGQLFASDMIDEDALFSDTSSVMDSTEAANMSIIDDETSSVGFSGDITSAFTITATRDWVLEGFHHDDTRVSPFIVGNLFLDARLPRGVKGFAAGEIMYAPVDSGAAMKIRELFVDVNIKHRLYFRTGKQILQWGRCALWNPTDLINIERKLFIERIGHREGSFGLRIHTPIGSIWNLYGFADLNDVSTIDSMAGTVKTEVLLGPVEMAAAIWMKRDNKPVFGFDLSTSVLDFLIAAEIGLFHGERFRKLDPDNALSNMIQLMSSGLAPEDITPPDIAAVISKPSEKIWAPRAAINVTKMFDIMDVDDRLSITAEFYYNHFGAVENDISKLIDLYTDLSKVVPLFGDASISSQQSAASLLYSSGVHEPGSLSRYYAAFFTTLTRFVVTDMSLSFNGLFNLVDGSGVMSTGLFFRSINNWNLGLLINASVGNDNCEYTVTGDAISSQCTVGIIF